MFCQNRTKYDEDDHEQMYRAVVVMDGRGWGGVFGLDCQRGRTNVACTIFGVRIGLGFLVGEGGWGQWDYASALCASVRWRALRRR